MHGFVRGLSRSAGVNHADQLHMGPLPMHYPPIGPGAAFKPRPGVQLCWSFSILYALFGC